MFVRCCRRPTRRMLRAGRNPTPELVAAIREQPRARQAVVRAVLVLHPRPGRCTSTSATATRTTSRSARPSSTACRRPLSLALGGAVVWLLVGIPIGIISAIKRGTILDRLAMGGALLAHLRARLLGRPGLHLPLLQGPRQAAADLRGLRPVHAVHARTPAEWFGALLLPWLVLATAFAGDLRALPARQPARRDGRGLHPHRPRQGPRRAPRRLQARPALGHHADRDHLRPRPRHPVRRRDPHRDRLQHPRASAASPSTRSRSPTCPIVQGTVLIAALADHPREPGRGHRVRIPRPAGQVLAMALLEIEDLKVHFDTDDGLVKAVDGISYSVDRGQTLGIVGESGSGKSVSSLTVMGLSRSRNARISGSIKFDGKELLDRLRRRPAPDPRRRHRDDLPGPAVLAAPLLQGGRADRRGDPRRTATSPSRRRTTARSRCSAWSASRSRASAPSPTRTSSPAACASAR